MQRVVVLVGPATPPQRLRQVVRWLRLLVPAAMLSVATVSPAAPPCTEDPVITVDADALDADAGPLAVAHALARTRAERRGPR